MTEIVETLARDLLIYDHSLLADSPKTENDKPEPLCLTPDPEI
jgi:hypothetical protein